MRHNLLLALRVIPVVFFLGLVFGLTTSAFAAGKVVSSERLPVDGAVVVKDEFGLQFDVLLSGTIHVVSQAYVTTDGLLVGLRANIASVQGVGDDFTEWVGVGANQYPPDPVVPPGPILCELPFDLIPLGSEVPPTLISPPVVNLVLQFDDVGHLLADGSSANIGGRTLPPDG